VVPLKHSLLTDLRNIPRPVWFLIGGTFLNRFGTFVVTFLVLYLTQRGYTPAQAGIALAVYGAGTFLASILGGHLADSIGRKYTIALSMFSSAATMIALASASSLPMIIVISFLAGATSELYRPAAAALIADLVEPDFRVTAYAMYRLAINAGVAAGPALAGFIAEKSFLFIFWGDAFTSLLYGVFALAALPHGIRSKREDSGWGAALRSAFNNRVFLLFIAGTACVTLVDFQMSATFALHVRDAGFSSAVYGALVSLNGAIIIFVEIFLTKGVQRFHRTQVVAAGYLLCGLGFALNVIAFNLPLLVAVIIVFTLGEMISSAVSSAFIADIAPPQFRGRYMGMFGFAWSFGMTAGPAIGASLYGYSPAAVWISCGVLGLAAAVLLLAAGRLGSGGVSPARSSSVLSGL
jgi:MFS family permease